MEETFLPSSIEAIANNSSKVNFGFSGTTTLARGASDVEANSVVPKSPYESLIVFSKLSFFSEIRILLSSSSLFKILCDFPLKRKFNAVCSSLILISNS